MGHAFAFQSSGFKDLLISDGNICQAGLSCATSLAGIFWQKIQTEMQWINIFNIQKVQNRNYIGVDFTDDIII